MLGLAWLFVAYRYFVWPQWPLFFPALTLMLGALVLGARLVRERPQPAQARSDALVLGTLGLIVVGWGTCQWSIRYLDWDFAMTWVGVAYLESHVWVFAPLIALKNVLPWLAIAWCLRDELWPATERPDNALLVGFTAKLAAVLMVNIGLAAADMAGGQYLFAAQLSGTMLLIGICVLVMPRAWPAATAAGATRDPPR